MVPKILDHPSRLSCLEIHGTQDNLCALEDPGDLVHPDNHVAPCLRQLQVDHLDQAGPYTLCHLLFLWQGFLEVQGDQAHLDFLLGLVDPGFLCCLG